VLGWTLIPLGRQHDHSIPDASSPKSMTKDHEINANGGSLGFLARSWYSLSHGKYREDKKGQNY
jgi:hypothetical protein